VMTKEEVASTLVTRVAEAVIAKTPTATTVEKVS